MDAAEAWKIDPANSKALYRMGKSLAQLGFYSKARRFYSEFLEKDKSEMQVGLEYAEIEYKVSIFSIISYLFFRQIHHRSTQRFLRTMTRWLQIRQNLGAACFSLI